MHLLECFFVFNVLRTLKLSCAASHTSLRVRAWRGTTPTNAESCPVQLPHFLSRTSTGGRGGPAWPPALRGFFSQTFPMLLVCTGASWRWLPSGRRLKGSESPNLCGGGEGDTFLVFTTVSYVVPHVPDVHHVTERDHVKPLKPLTAASLRDAVEPWVDVWSRKSH